MKYSQLFTKTLKEAPKDEVSKNAQLLIRAGFAHKEMAGVYAYLPLGLRVLEKIEQIVREEMNAIGCQEIIMTSLQRKSLWEQTDRWDDEIVDIWFKSKLHAGGEVGLAWSHEEPIGNMLKNHISSYKDLPVYVYQFQKKLRNELRAKSGVMRGREFTMKDAYTFCVGEEDHEAIYEAMKVAYMNCFRRMGLGDDTYITFASGGAFTEYSHEFQTICEAGEDELYHVPGTDIYFNKEIAPAQAPALDDSGEEIKDREDVLGEGLIGVDTLAEFLKIPVVKTTKTILFLADQTRIVAAAVRGGYDIDTVKLKKILNCQELILLPEDKVREVTGAEVGYAGMLDLPDTVEQYWDESTKGRTNFEMGANKTNYHSININFGRDIDEPAEFYDFKEAVPGDIHPESGKVYKVFKAAEVGNIFNFGRQKAADLELRYKDEKGQEIPVWMGSYGIGITRVMGVIVEKFADDKGIVWPESVAPFRVHLIQIGDDDKIVKATEDLYQELTAKGIEVLHDERAGVSAGAKFADADLIGIPYRVVSSSRSHEAGGFEWKLRSAEESEVIPADEVMARLTA